jgi:hypothetical protein
VAVSKAAMRSVRRWLRVERSGASSTQTRVNPCHRVLKFRENSCAPKAPKQHNSEEGGSDDSRSIVPARHLALLTTAVLLVSGCGGGSSDSPAPTPALPSPAPPAPSTVSGVVVIAAPAPVPLPPSIPPLPTPPPVPPPGSPPPPPPVPTPAPAPAAPAAPTVIAVCFDANKNGICDATEPSTNADAQGAFTLAGLPSIQPSGAAVLAVVTPGSGEQPYTLQAPVGKAGVVSAVTTLIQAGVTQGLSLSQSEIATARQLQLNQSDLYVNYAASTGKAAEAMLITDWAIVNSLRDSIPLVVGVASQTPSELVLSRLSYTNAQTWDARFYHYTNSHSEQTGIAEFYVLPAGKLNGTTRIATSLLLPLWADGPYGWVPGLVEANVNFITSGSPYITLWGNGARNASVETEVDVSGRSIASVVQEAQDSALNSPATITGVPTSSLVGNMPSGAKVKYVKWKARYGDQYLDGTRVAGITTLSGLVASYSLPSSPTPTSTFSLGGSTPTGTCVNNICPGYNVRVAFDTSSNRIDYYRCDSDTALTTISNCVASTSGTYTIGTSNDGVTPMMRFTNAPGAVAHSVVEREGQLHLISSSGTGFAAGSAVRLNRVAFDALAATLGIGPAPTLTSRSPHLGIWRASYVGTYSGNCMWLLVDALGNLGGNCTSTTAASFNLVGTVSGPGSFNATGSGNAFGGVFQATSASGTWTQSTGSANGTWTAMKR